MRAVSLGSGSSGNALVVQLGQAAILVDAGLGPRTLMSRLKQAGIVASTLRAILITHEHSDHSCGAVKLARQLGIPLIADPRTLGALLAMPAHQELAATTERVELPLGRSLRLGTLEVMSFPISHDAVAPGGYVIGSAAWRVCVATDTGIVTEPMIEAMRTAHLLVVESNHDITRLTRGPYPWHLKQRILSPTGHLSNEQTSQALVRVLDDGPRWVWLAHLSRTNNTPELARTHVREHLRAAGLRHIMPVSLPPTVGPLWDSAALLGVQTLTQPMLPDVGESVLVSTRAARPMEVDVR